MMCTTTIGTLTLAAMLQDPLIRMVMRSDNVSEEAYSDLLSRVQRALHARADVTAASVSVAVAV